MAMHKPEEVVFAVDVVALREALVTEMGVTVGALETSRVPRPILNLQDEPIKDWLGTSSARRNRHYNKNIYQFHHDNMLFYVFCISLFRCFYRILLLRKLVRKLTVQVILVKCCGNNSNRQKHCEPDISTKTVYTNVSEFHRERESDMARHATQHNPFFFRNISPPPQLGRGLSAEARYAL